MVWPPPPAPLTPAHTGFAILGCALPVVNFVRGTTLLAQARATAVSAGTTMTVPYPTQATAITPNMPGLSAGQVQAQVWQQTGRTPTFLLGRAAPPTAPTPRGLGGSPPTTNHPVRPPAPGPNTGRRFGDPRLRLPRL